MRATPFTWSSTCSGTATLGYVYLEDGTFVNAWLVEQWYGQVMTVPPNVKCQELFLKLQREARRGLWEGN